MKQFYSLFGAFIALALSIFALNNSHAQPYFYSPHVQTFITGYGCSNCHGGSSGLTLSTYTGVLNGGTQCAQTARPFDDNSSPLVIKIDCSVPLTCGSSRMPLGGGCTVSAADIAIIRNWIKGGALENNTYCQSFTGAPLSITFSGFGGGGFTSAPSASQLSSKVWNFSGFSDLYKPGQSNTGNDFARGATTPGAPTSGGIYGCTYTAGNQALWLQPASNDFSSPNGGIINLQICNNSSSAITTLNVAYDLLVYNDQDRANSFNFAYSTNGVTYTPVSALDYTSPATADASPTAAVIPKNTTLTGLNIPNGAIFFLRWTSNDVSGVGNRDEFGLDNITVSLPVTCNISGVNATTAVCSSTSANFSVSFTVAGGSGTYNVINTSNNLVLASGSSSPIAVSIANSTGGSISINVVDAAAPSCAGIPIQVNLPDCTPVCAITGVSADLATCSGTSAVFNVLFTAANGSGVYNVINTANNNILSTGSSSPIVVSIANSTGGSITINVVDAGNPTCAGMPVTVSLPNCPPPVFCGNGTCDGAENFCTCAADCACVATASFINFDVSNNPVSSPLPVAFCLQAITGQTNPTLPHYLYVPVRISGPDCVSYTATASQGTLFTLLGNNLQPFASITNNEIVWLRMSQADITGALGGTTLSFSGAGGNCTASQNITWATVVNYTGTVATTCKAPLNLTVILGGAYNTTANNGAMRTDINALLPTNSPYSVAPWNAPPISVAAPIPTDMVDWVLVQLLNTANNAVVESQAALLSANGTVYNAQLKQGLTFVANGTFKVAVKHRNHLAVLSANAFDPNGGSVNFTLPANVQGGNSQLVQVGTLGLFGLIPGDLNANGIINFADYNVYATNTGSTSYNPADCNFDGIVSISDFTLMLPHIKQMGVTPIRY
ncbi:MAG TPA: hypothetical protein PK239_16045 [Chitinophagales bacterium]|nr:hypothetical protein [Chitinophagales bacterium]HRK28787.1 hypothetical protein [Chitinophagales bacterium]